jgi:hypothetical protein
MTRPPSRTAQRTSRIATLVVAGVSLVAGLGAIAIDLAALPTHPDPPMSAGWSGVLPGLALLIPGCLLLWRLPWHPIAVVLAGFGALWVVDGLLIRGPHHTKTRLPVWEPGLRVCRETCDGVPME